MTAILKRSLDKRFVELLRTHSLPDILVALNPSQDRSTSEILDAIVKERQPLIELAAQLEQEKQRTSVQDQAVGLVTDADDFVAPVDNTVLTQKQTPVLDKQPATDTAILALLPASREMILSSFQSRALAASRLAIMTKHGQVVVQNGQYVATGQFVQRPRQKAADPVYRSQSAAVPTHVAVQNTAIAPEPRLLYDGRALHIDDHYLTAEQTQSVFRFVRGLINAVS